MSNVGVQPSGFVRKSLAEILDEIEQSNVSTFGPGIIQTSQSPLGQLNGMVADVAAEVWEVFEAVYDARDPAQAEGFSLDILGRIRLLARGDLGDEAFRRGMMNDAEANVELGDFVTLLRAIPGVTYARVIINDRPEPNTDGIPRNSICAVVMGGADDAIADVVSRFVVPGVSSFGNTTISKTLDGYCRSFFIARPVLVPITLRVALIIPPARNGCPTPALTAIAESLAASFVSLDNGEDLTEHNVRARLARLYPDVQIVSMSAGRNGRTVPLPTPISFYEIASVTVLPERADL